MEMTVHLYGLFDPSTKYLHYIGITRQDIKARLRQHIYAVNKGKLCFKTLWLDSILKQGIAPEIAILETFSSTDEAEEAERFYISYFTFLGCPLTNSTSGGEALKTYIPAAREKMKQKRWSQYTPEQRTAMAKAANPVKPPLPIRTCPECGKSFQPNKNNPHTIHCSRACASKKNHRIYDLGPKKVLVDIPCEACGKMFLPRASVLKNCSKECGRIARHNRTMLKFPPVPCPICGKEFIPRRNKKRKKTCSRSCACSLANKTFLEKTGYNTAVARSMKYNKH